MHTFTQFTRSGKIATEKCQWLVAGNKTRSVSQPDRSLEHYMHFDFGGSTHVRCQVNPHIWFQTMCITVHCCCYDLFLMLLPFGCSLSFDTADRLTNEKNYGNSLTASRTQITPLRRIPNTHICCLTEIDVWCISTVHCKGLASRTTTIHRVSLWAENSLGPYVSFSSVLFHFIYFQSDFPHTHKHYRHEVARLPACRNRHTH